MANMCAGVTSTYMEFTLAFGPKPEFSFSFKWNLLTKRTYVCIIKNTNVCSFLRSVKREGWFCEDSGIYDGL